jgi:hypothetical protein
MKKLFFFISFLHINITLLSFNLSLIYYLIYPISHFYLVLFSFKNSNFLMLCKDFVFESSIKLLLFVWHFNFQRIEIT